ncbi:hypothetical protein EJ03DRAFT_295198 [Teratosphaeria nubilosa]|uniref:BTB domain-containing protein n=1 Tax=Teratosphaeria nubilosa TaxID=161662 RepID=A0A6G1L6A6_9PEZI|nr:hypothetical protein EJ03DRAFT_295198 [Teratosphaeria nubilosa]
MADERAVKKALSSTPDCRPAGEALCGEIIELHVGTNEAPGRIFRAHKDLLNFYSGYFQAATNGKFVEAEKGRIYLPNDDVYTVHDFMTWLYTRDVPRGSGWCTIYSRLCKLWIWASLLEVPLLANMVIDAIRDENVRTWRLPTNQIKLIWENTAAGSKLRAMIAMLFGTYSLDRNITSEINRSSWVADAIWDVLKVVLERQRKGVTKQPTKEELSGMDLCDYHIHGEGVKCAKKV